MLLERVADGVRIEHVAGRSRRSPHSRQPGSGSRSWAPRWSSLGGRRLLGCRTGRPLATQRPGSDQEQKVPKSDEPFAIYLNGKVANFGVTDPLGAVVTNKRIAGTSQEFVLELFQLDVGKELADSDKPQLQLIGKKMIACAMSASPAYKKMMLN